MANKDLTAKVKLDTSSAEKSLNRLAKKLNDVQRAVNRTTKNNSKLSTQINKAVTATNKLNTATNKVANTANKVANTARKVNSANAQAAKSAQRLSSSYRTANHSASGLLGTVKRLAATYLGVMGAGAMIRTSDTMTSSQNRLDYLAGQNGGGANYTAEAMDKMYVSAQKVRMSYTDMMANVSKSMTLAGNAFEGNIDNAIRFQEIMAEAYAVGGASAAEMHSSMYQMIQALGSGVLQGDELRSVREGAPLAYKAIEQFAQGVYNTTDSLKDLASEGKITAEMVVAAVMNAGNEMDSAFAQTAQTFAQTWEQIKNAAQRAFLPVSNMLRDALNKAVDNGMIEKFESFFTIVSKGLQIIFKLIEKGANWIADNWQWVISAIISYIAVWTTCTVISAAIRIAALIAEYGWLIVIWAAVATLVWLFIEWKNGAVDTCNAIATALLVVAMAALVLGIILNAPWLIWVAVVAMAVAIVIHWFEYIAGGVMWLAATIYNIGVGVVNALIQQFYSTFVEPIAGIIEWFVNAFNGGFNGILGAAANAIGQLVSIVLGGLKIITSAIDAVAGTSFTAKVTGWQDSAKSWGKNENAVTYKVTAPQLSRVSATDAYEMGKTWGSYQKTKLNDLGSKFQNGFDGLSANGMLDNMGEKLGLNFGGFPSASNPANALGNGAGSIPSKVGDIADNTGSMADAMDLTEEDLEYLRKLAAMEWKKEYTTANITVDMSNYNTISGETDLDGIVTRLADKVYEEMDYLANGVYA